MGHLGLLSRSRCLEATNLLVALQAQYAARLQRSTAIHELDQDQENYSSPHMGRSPLPTRLSLLAARLAQCVRQQLLSMEIRDRNHVSNKCTENHLEVPQAVFVEQLKTSSVNIIFFLWINGFQSCKNLKNKLSVFKITFVKIPLKRFILHVYFPLVNGYQWF